MVPTGIDELDARLISAPGRDASGRGDGAGPAAGRGARDGTGPPRQAAGAASSPGFDPDLDLEALGYEVLAFVTLEIAQGRLADVVDHLADIPEVLEAHATTGPGDLHGRVVARTNEHLQHVIGGILEVSGIDRTTTQIALTEQIRFRVLPLVDQVR